MGLVPMSLTANQIDALRELEEVWPDARVVIIGATALAFYYDMRWRQTADVDLVITIDLEDFPGGLLERPGWNRHPTKEHEFRSPQGTKLDLLPAGSNFLETRELTWPSGHVMNLAGMDLVFEHAERHAVSDDRGALVAPPPVVSVLKMTSYCDRPAERERDLEDIAHLLDGYVDDDSDRRFDEALGQDFDRAPAYLMGLDIGRITHDAYHDELVGRFLQRVTDPDALPHATMRARGPRHWRSDDSLSRCLDAFRAGLADGRATRRSD